MIKWIIVHAFRRLVTTKVKRSPKRKAGVALSYEASRVSTSCLTCPRLVAAADLLVTRGAIHPNRRCAAIARLAVIEQSLKFALQQQFTEDFFRWNDLGHTQPVSQRVWDTTCAACSGAS